MNDLIISSTSIRRDADGRFSLNDLHRAAGGESKHQPSNWLRLDHTRALCAEIDQSSEVRSAQAVNGGAAPGTYVVKELVYSYAMWISPAFHLKVIRAYDGMGNPAEADPIRLLGDPAAMRGLLLHYTERVISLEGKVQEMQPTVVAFRRIADADGSLTLRESAKALQQPERKLAQWMHSAGWLFRAHKGGWMGYADKTQAGYLTHKVHTYFDEKDQEDKVSHQVRVTPKGLTRLAEMLGVTLASEEEVS